MEVGDFGCFANLDVFGLLITPDKEK